MSSDISLDLKLLRLQYKRAESLHRDFECQEIQKKIAALLYSEKTEKFPKCDRCRMKFEKSDFWGKPEFYCKYVSRWDRTNGIVWSGRIKQNGQGLWERVGLYLKYLIVVETIKHCNGFGEISLPCAIVSENNTQESNCSEIGGN